jgi:hypothetical protein
LHPTGKLYPDEPSGDVAVQSDSALRSPPVSKPASGSESDLTTDLVTPDRGPVLVDFGLGLDEAGAGGSQLGVISGTPA